MENHEADIEPVAAAVVEEQKIDNITVAIKNVIRKSLAVDGKLSTPGSSEKTQERQPHYFLQHF